MATAYGYDGNGITAGGRVELSPATDSWMRGDRYADVLRVLGDGEAVEIRLDKSRKVKKLFPCLLRAID